MRGALSPKRKKGSLTAPSCLHFCSNSFLPFQSRFRSNSTENEFPGFLVSSQPPYQAQGTNPAPGGRAGSGQETGLGRGLARGGASWPEAQTPAPFLLLRQRRGGNRAEPGRALSCISFQPKALAGPIQGSSCCQLS